MAKKRAAFTLLYVVIAIIEIISAVNGKNGWVYVFKPALMVALLLWSIFSPDLRDIKGKNFFLAGMMLACLGDIFLMLPGDWFFQGLFAFLLMQWLYIYVFFKDIGSFSSALFWLALVPIVVVLMGMNYVLLSALADPKLAVAVTVYAVSIATMVLFALLRKSEALAMSFYKVAVGAILFLISDALLAINEFVAPLPDATIWVMSTYSAAQYLIVVGMLRTHSYKKSRIPV